jgi:murein lipoprotein
MKTTTIKVAIIAAAIAVASGCASTSQLAEVRSIAESAQSAANNAASQSSSALSTANQALEAARAAQSAANAAQACCDANTSKLDKVFEQVMKK